MSVRVIAIVSFAGRTLLFFMKLNIIMGTPDNPLSLHTRTVHNLAIKKFTTGNHFSQSCVLIQTMYNDVIKSGYIFFLIVFYRKTD